MESIEQYKRDEAWSPAEKKLARIAFDKEAVYGDHSRSETNAGGYDSSL
jgi:hypothetical protein